MNYNIEIRHLRYFNALAEELHFRKAAERLYITQPGLSRQIMLMEEEMGVELFKRSKKHVSLTQAGEYFKEETEYILNHVQHVINQARSIQSGHEGELRIGFVGSAMQKVIPDLLLNLNKSNPGIRTSLDELSNDQQILNLMHDKLDIGFIRKNDVPDEIVIHPVTKETFSLVLPEDHILNGINFNDVSQLKDESFILFNRLYSPEYFSNVMSIFEDQGYTPHITHRSVHASTIFRLVENGLGIAIVPTSLTSGFNMKVKFIELKNIQQRTILYVCYKEGNRNSALKHFIQFL
ncbi:MAG: LysR family transcriptional regulator [Saprospiraceae bacterium]|nr:LysR family transcriptional regulator [Saprospiraceae bacterium]